MDRKIRVGVIFGGRSAEHEVSLQSAQSIISALDPDRFEVTLIGIDKQGEWSLCDHAHYLTHADGLHTISATATDTSGTTNAYVFSFTVQNGRRSGFTPAQIADLNLEATTQPR